MTADLLWQHAEDVEEVMVAWLAPLRRSGVARQVGDPLPFTLITHITGAENPDIGTADPVVQIDTLCDKALDYDAAQIEAAKTHDRILQLSRYLDTITLSDGRQANVDYVNVFESPKWQLYGDVTILRKVGRYVIGLSYVPAN